ncbi:chemotaxis protein CheB [Longimicrobium terrae]|uniref:protein-glutamate methylesterase n=1 Tax=Longimicrobium terrae TaxID=1639882 RepID=A0A841H2X5_9BACT|nr:two-component system chemotaxis response regulator CheB [Longimicrobium terrae]MBB6072377.1 two-component system chemotaxis response regulator CheB [Longimicrobium terrae]
MSGESEAGYRMVVVGASAGGLYALRTLIAGLPADFDMPVVVVQHRAKESELLCELLQECTPLPVTEVMDKQEIGPGVFIGPPDYHLLVDDGSFALSTDDPVRYSRPSIDVMFQSAAETYGMDTVGVVLTGANQDGSAGLRQIADAGGHCVVQDPETAEVRVMPRSALKAVPDACVLTLEEIGPHLAGIRGRRVPPCPPRDA